LKREAIYTGSLKKESAQIVGRKPNNPQSGGLVKLTWWNGDRLSPIRQAAGDAGKVIDR